MSRRQELAGKRAVLVARCEHERQQFGIATDGVMRSFQTVDSAVRIARRAAMHPALLAGVAVAVIVIVRPRRLWQFLVWGSSAAVASRRIASLWRAWR